MGKTLTTKFVSFKNRRHILMSTVLLLLFFFLLLLLLLLLILLLLLLLLCSLLAHCVLQSTKEILGLSCTDNSYKNFVAQLRNTSEDPLGFSMMRQWYYQTCTQFGYCEYLQITGIHSTPESNIIFGYFVLILINLINIIIIINNNDNNDDKTADKKICCLICNEPTILRL